MNTIARVTLLLGALGVLASTAPAQTFGRNAVQYKTFHFKILKTQHFDVYFYDEEADAAAQAARMAERWYTRISTVLRHQLSGRQPLILDADHPAYNQSNIAQVEGSEGVTESLKRRILLPLGASPFETDHVIGHELTHAFQYDITGVARGNMAAAFNRVPLWFIEGMAEYVSLGNVDPNTTMWMRDAVRTGRLPKFRDLENPRYFPYRWGQSFWAYLGGTYGDDIVGALLRSAGRSGNVQAALEQMTHRPADSLIADWHRALTDAARPIAVATGTPLPTDRAQRDQARLTPVTTAGARSLVGPGKEQHYNLAPALSPDGSRVVYFSDAGLFSIDMYLANAENGHTIRKLVSSTRDPHLESMQFINSAGAWSTDGRFAFGAIVTGRPALRIVKGDDGDLIKEIKFPSLGEIFNPTWSPDGGAIAQVTNVFTGVSGITSLSPALSVAQKAPRAVFAVYSDGGYAIQAIDDIRALEGGPIVQLPATAAALPPLDRAQIGTSIAAVIKDPEPVPPAATVALNSAVKEYHPKLSLDFIAQPSLAVAADRFGTYIGGGATLYWSDMLGDHNLVTMAQFQGRISDFAAATAYLNRKSRLNWAVGAQQIPYIFYGYAAYQDPNGVIVEEIERFKQTNRGLNGVMAYPFNRSDRVEISGGLQQISYDDEIQKHGFNQNGSVAFDSTIHNPVPPAVTLEATSFSLVHDNSFYGATSPILGDRWRLEADPTFGGLQFFTAYAAYRKYG